MRLHACALAVSAIFAAPLAAQAQTGGFTLSAEPEPTKPVKVHPDPIRELSLGGVYVDEDSAKFGEYNGFDEQGFYPVFELMLLQDLANGGQIDLRGQRLGEDAGYLDARYRDPGAFELEFNYLGIPHNLSDSARTPYLGVGGDQLILPGGWVATEDTATLPTLDRDLRSFDLRTERERIGAGGTVHLNRRWSVSLNVQREERDGVKPLAGLFGINGGNPATMFLPEPTEYTTDEVTAAIAYAGERFNIRAQYLGSFFENDNPALQFQNIFSGNPSGGDWPGDPDYAGFNSFGRGQIGLPPDNQAHYFSLDGNYMISPRTHVSGLFRYGMMEQDERFLPYTINPMLDVPQALPRDSLDGEIDETLFSVRLTSRPTQAWHFRTGYRYEDRDNDTPRDVYLIVHNDTSNQGSLDSSDARRNLPYSFTEHEAYVDGQYRFNKNWKGQLGYTFTNKERTFAEVEETRDHEFRVGADGRVSNGVRTSIKYTHARRTGDDYVDNLPFLEGHGDTYLATLAEDERFENHPAIRKYHLADRDRNALDLSAQIMPWERWGLNLRAHLSRDDYDDSELGLQQRDSMQFTVEPNYRFSEDVFAYAYYSYGERESELDGHQFRPFPPLDSLTEASQRWSVDTNDEVHTFGAGLTWENVRPNLDLSLEYSRSSATTEYDVSAGSELGMPLGIPDVESDLDSIRLKATYRHKENLSYHLLLAHERFDTDDFAYDDVEVDSIPNVLGFGEDSPNYSVNLIGLSMSVKF